MTARLSKTVVVGGVIYPAGGTVPDDVAKAITAPGVWAEGAEPHAAVESEGYSSKTADDLRDEIAKRNEGRTEDELIVPGGKGNKPDLVAALIADDES